MSLGSFADVRMKGFRQRAEFAAVLRLIDERTVPLVSEHIESVNAAGRVLAESVVSPVDVPSFPRAAMDGYAVRTAEEGPRRIAGTALPGEPFAGKILPGQSVRIMTGAAIPSGADAVIRAEDAVEDHGEVRLTSSAATGMHIIRIGEDVKKGTEVLAAGRVFRPQDIGLLAALGVHQIAVFRRPRVALLATGDELLPTGSIPNGTQIIDSNSPMLAALVHRDGGLPLSTRYVRDDLDSLRDAIRTAEADVLLISGGSSVGQEDHAPRAVAELGELAVHGIALKPAGPTGIGFLGNRIVFLLPGNPGSCHCAYDLFAGRAIRRLGGRSGELPYRTVQLSLTDPISSTIGRTDYILVKIVNGTAEPLGGASRLGTAVAADGFILVPSEAELLPAGQMVEIFLYE